jgi:hypothetical protein
MSNLEGAPRKRRSKIWLSTREDLLAVVANSNSLAAILKHFDIAASSGNYTILKRRLRQEQIDFSHINLGISSNKGRKGMGPNAIPLDQILVEHSTYSRRGLKTRLLKLGLLENKCYECGIGPEWNGKPLSLQLDHINGASDDNRLENLRMLCPNCHTQTETFGSKRRKGTGKPEIRISDIDPDWQHKPRPHTRKVERPSKEELHELLWSISIRQIAKQFGVTGSTIVMWAKLYQIPRPPRGHWDRLRTESRRPSKEELEKLLWKFLGDDVCRMFKTDRKTLNKWIKHHGIVRPPPGYWKKKENIRQS